MPQRPGEHSRSKTAGQYQRSKPLTAAPPSRGPRWTIPKMPASEDVVLHWNENGSLYEDAALTRPTGLQIFASVDDETDYGEDDEP